jgi:hypothetical protein
MYRKFSENIVVTLPNGLTLNGERNVVEKAIAQMGYLNSMYYSESKNEWIPISEMDTRHLANATLKMMRLLVPTIKDYLGETIRGDLMKSAHVVIEQLWMNKRLVNMIQELKSREEYPNDLLS